MTELRSRAPADAAGAPLCDWLARRFTYFDAAGWRAQLAAGRVQLDGRVAAGDERLGAGAEVVFTPAAAAPSGRPAPAVLFEDAWLVAVDKPAHAVAHRDGAFVQHTFLHDLERQLGAASPLHLVHRLDRETSGVLLLAREPATVTAVQAQFTAGQVEKRYLALVRGVVADDAVVIDAPIGSAGSAIRHRQAVLAAGTRGARSARTELRVVERFAEHTLVALTPRTGRTHQLRVHLAHLGHAIEGDVLYGEDEACYLAFTAHLKQGGDPRWPAGRKAGRQLLHAQQLALRHPRSGAALVLEATPPAEFLAALAALGPRH
ncbi:MAG: RluA family pseudouridine synthase [Planctomycetes bacterium]|nr:RluA family pseudouridine synthase [Planctomycetota bacterium]